MRIKELLGMHVLDIDANDIGKVDDVDFNKSTGEIEKIAVSLKKNLLSRDEVLIHYNNIQSMGDYVLLNITINNAENNEE